jgi:hypothetical protein
MQVNVFGGTQPVPRRHKAMNICRPVCNPVYWKLARSAPSETLGPGRSRRPPETLGAAADALVRKILANVPLAMWAIRAMAVRGRE